MLNWLKKHFRRKPKGTVTELEEENDSDKPKVIILDNNPLSIASYLEEFGDPTQKEPPKYTIPEVPKAKINFDVLKQDLQRDRRNSEIAQKNLERQQNTMNYGLHGKFKPRSHHEKSLWKLDAKPTEED